MIYQQAKEFLDRGIGIAPIPYKRKIPAGKWEIYQSTLPTAGDLASWFPCGLRNYAIILGWQRLSVLDFDDMGAWYDWQLWTIDNCRLLDNAYRVKTNRGVHIYFLLLEETSNMKLPGIDFKCHGYCIGPGSVHPSGHVYKALNKIHFPLIEKLSDILPAEMLAQAISERENMKPVAQVQQRAPAGDLFSEAENAAPPSAGVLSPLEIALSRFPIESFFPGVKANSRGFGSVDCLFHSPDNASAWFSVDKQLFGCSRCNFKPMSPVGLYASLYCENDIKRAVKEMSQ